MATRKTLIVKNATIMFPNFSGNPSKFNAAGNRNFCLAVDPETAEQLKADGWNVKTRVNMKDPDAEPVYYVQIKVNFNKQNPSGNPIIKQKVDKPGAAYVTLDEDMVGRLDHAEFVSVDVEVNPYKWEINGKTGTKGYLSKLKAVISADFFEDDEEDEEVPF